jgi:hypothetical protein
MKRREETWHQRDARESAQQRLATRFWRDWMSRSMPRYVGATDAIDVVISAVNDRPVGGGHGSLEFPEIRAEDALDALRVTQEAIVETTRRIESTEMELIEIARLAGASWAEIGASYNYQTQPGTHARRRYQTLRKQWPGHTPSPEAEAAINAPDPSPKETT